MSKTDQLPNPLIPLSSTQVSLESVGGKAMNLAQLARNADFCRFMTEARNIEEIVELLEEVG